MNRNKKNGVFRTVAACTLSAAMLLSGGCGPQGGRQGGRPGGGKIAVITKQPIAFWDDVKLGAMDAGKELGYEIIYNVAEGDNDYASQVDYIKQAMNAGVRAIVIAPNSQTDLNDVLQQAVDKGIKVIAINSNVISPDSNNPLTLSLINSSDFDGGVAAARNVVKGWREKGKDVADIKKIGIIGSTASTSDMRVLGFTDTLKRSIGKTRGVEFDALNMMAIIMGGAGAAMGGGAPGGEGDWGGAPDGSGAEGAAFGDAEGAAAGGDAAAYGADGAAAAEEQNTEELTPAELELLAKQKEKDAADERIRQDIMMSFVQSEPCSKRKEAKEQAMKLLGTDGNGFSVLFGTNTNSTLGICDAINELGLSGKVFAVGFNSDDEIISNIKNGVLYGTVVQNPYVMGYVGVKFATAAITGEQLTNHLNTGVSFVKADNMNDDFIKLMLDPASASSSAGNNS
ncbi:MAG: substrate-binding domain-containing protein [Ruminococcus sp.]|uniref:sugar ABC transporter substrate-binding protein n=1 Tax=Ruminococcus sp. TaxID=41978 RepID=UPI0025CF138A|nr:substrate-binding domain-containing protein [Ruminococcus sp.]MBR5683892.1 substrate-binding domain-containing protein [Ruminococcus sp.]